MKLLIMCEGPNELAMVKMLLELRCLKFTSDDLLGLVPFHARQIKTSPAVKLALNIYTGPVKIIRIGDNQTDAIKIPTEYKARIIDIKKYCTKPELEILLIIAENLMAEYEKVKSVTKPKEFAKRYIKNGRTRYNNSTEFYHDYFANDFERLINAIIFYRKMKRAHKKDELYLADLLNGDYVNGLGL
jgi:hypothetical protein